LKYKKVNEGRCTDGQHRERKIGELTHTSKNDKRQKDRRRDMRDRLFYRQKE
jgi:hypothetical protein